MGVTCDTKADENNNQIGEVSASCFNCKMSKDDQ